MFSDSFLELSLKTPITASELELLTDALFGNIRVPQTCMDAIASGFYL